MILTNRIKNGTLEGLDQSADFAKILSTMFYFLAQDLMPLENLSLRVVLLLLCKNHCLRLKTWLKWPDWKKSKITKKLQQLGP